MVEQIYKELMQKFAKRGGRYPGMDIPEFYEMARELFTPEEASIAVALPKGFSTAEQLAETTGRKPEELESTLQKMARKGLCRSGDMGGTEVYNLPPFVPGIFEHQFMRGTKTENDRKLARVIHKYKEAVDAINGMPKISFPPARVIPVDEQIEAGNAIHTYDQMSSYVEKSDPISVCACYCRHEAELLDENDTCGAPNDVCMQFGMGARFVIDKGLGREISKKEAIEILKKSEEAGLVHCSTNQQDIDFVCNCCADHCIILKAALAQPQPGLALNSGFQPRIDQEECTECELCIENCPSTALALSEDQILLLDLDRCFGCGICATTCPTEAIALVEKAGYPEPPVDHQALREAFKAEAAAS
jgi:2-oxoacid:acceptor oxidoreductase delta subunit (pyruvate/2-ketoisovalerate family)